MRNRYVKYLRYVLLLWLVAVGWSGESQTSWRAAFWNVENFFDTQHDTLKSDDAFTPQGENHWTTKRYAEKRNKIFKMVAAMGYPTIVGLAEVENDAVLRDLCLFTPLRRFHYQFVHYESADRRGADCALLYRSDWFRPTESVAWCMSDSTEGFFTRDMLMVGGVVGNDSCYLIVNHWPSKLGGATADRHRMRIARKLRSVMDSLQQVHPSALVLAMGDLNADRHEEAISVGLGFADGDINPEGFYYLMHEIAPGTGSYKYQGQWSCIDQMVANRNLQASVFSPNFALTADKRNMGVKPLRTYSGLQYIGGFSDHLPIVVDIPIK